MACEHTHWLCNPERERREDEDLDLESLELCEPDEGGLTDYARDLLEELEEAKANG